MLEDSRVCLSKFSSFQDFLSNVSGQYVRLMKIVLFRDIFNEVVFLGPRLPRDEDSQMFVSNLFSNRYAILFLGAIVEVSHILALFCFIDFRFVNVL